MFFHKQHLKKKKKTKKKVVCCKEMTKRLSYSPALGTRLSNFYGGAGISHYTTF